VQDYSPNIPGWKPGMPQSRSVYSLPGGWYALAYTADGKHWYTYEGLPSGLETQR